MIELLIDSIMHSTVKREKKGYKTQLVTVVWHYKKNQTSDF